MKKQKVKIVYRERIPEGPNKSKLNEEIAELEGKRNALPTGSGFFGRIGSMRQKAALNFEINQRKATIRASNELDKLKVQNKLAKERIELEKAKEDMTNLRKKNMVKFEDLF